MNIQEYKGVWTVGEVRNGKISDVSYELLAWGRKLADDLGVELSSVVLGNGMLEELNELIYHGADSVYAVENENLEHFLPDVHSRIFKALVEEYKPEIIIASATTYGRTVMPILAAELSTGLTADCTELNVDTKERLLLQTRPAIGGNVMATIKTPNNRPQMSTVRPKAKKPLERDENRKGKIVRKEYPSNFYESKYRWISFEKDESVDSPIQESDVIVAGGKGMKDEKNFKLLYEVAKKLNGAVGASRPAVDMGWIPYSHQIGLSGKTVSPRFYMAFGISGAVQHVAGMSSAETVVAVNTDPDAPIFKVADFGIIGDALELLPVLVKRLSDEVKSNG
jgi:electron transfer flavoprotein alpha subunit